MEQIIFHIEDGKATNGTAIRKLFSRLKDGKYYAVIKQMNRRSNNQNAYYFGCVISMIKERMIELGNEVDTETVHDYLKDRFNSKELFTKYGVNIGSVGNSTTGLTKLEFEEYLEKCKRFAAEVLDIYIPNPNEQADLYAMKN